MQTVNRQIRWTFVFWLAVMAFFVAALVLFSGFLMPFVAGLILAYILDPVADRLQRMKFTRLQATFIVLGGIFFVITVLLVILLPLLAQELADFLKTLPDLLKSIQSYITEKMRALQKGTLGPLIAERMQNAKNPIDSMLNESATVATTFLGSLWLGGQAVFETLSLILITPIVACYLLYDWDRMVAHIDALVPLRSRKEVRKIASEINSSVASYLRGQAVVCIVLGFLYAIGLSFFGLNFSLLIGISSGLISFIPYIGNVIGLGTALLIALTQFGLDYTILLGILAVYATGQMIDGYILQPKYIGNAVGIHPVWLIFALYAFGSLFGFAGLLLAVPLAACVSVLMQHALRYYAVSPLFLGPDGGLKNASPKSLAKSGK